MGTVKVTKVLLWAEVRPAGGDREIKVGFIIKVEDGKYNIVDRKSEREIDVYKGRMVKVKPGLMESVAAHFKNRVGAPMFGDLANSLKNVLDSIS